MSKCVLIKSGILKRHIVILGIILIRLCFDLGFYIFVLPRYPQYFFMQFNALNYILTWFFLVITFLPLMRLMRKKHNTFSGSTTLLLYIFAYVPSSTLCGLMFNDYHFLVCLNAFWLILLFFISIEPKNKMNRAAFFDKLKLVFPVLIKRKPAKLLFNLISVFFAISSIIIIYNFNAFRFSFSFANPYEARANAAGSFSMFGSLMMYITAVVIVPILIPVLLHRKRFFLFALLSLLQLLLFMVGGNKFYILLYIVGIIAYYSYSQKSVYHIPLVLGVCFALANLLVVINRESFFSIWVYDIVIRRIFFMPAQISYYYFDFFQTNPLLWMCDDPVLVRLGHHGPYSQAIANVIGLFYWGEIGANNGTFGNAFSEFGYLSIVIYPVIYTVFLNILDYATFGIDSKMYIVLSISLSTHLTNGSIIGIQYTYVLFAFILFILMNAAKFHQSPIERKGFIKKHVQRLKTE